MLPKLVWHKEIILGQAVLVRNCSRLLRGRRLLRRNSKANHTSSPERLRVKLMTVGLGRRTTEHYQSVACQLCSKSKLALPVSRNSKEISKMPMLEVRDPSDRGHAQLAPKEVRVLKDRIDSVLFKELTYVCIHTQCNTTHKRR
jgi:hypothetical protein